MDREKHRGGWWMVALLSMASLGAAGRDGRLAEAVKNGDRVAVRALVQQRVDVNTSQADGMTPLHWAAQRNDVETADLLIRAGATATIATRHGVTPLALACANGSAGMIERLLKAGADPNSASAEGETALMTAARTGEVDALKVLVAHGADVNAVEGWKKQTALMWAAGEGHAAAIQMLVEAGANIHARSKGGLTPLQFAVREGRVEAVRALLAAGASANESAPMGASVAYRSATLLPGEQFETSALIRAIINAHYELAAVLLEHGADPNVVDGARGSALHALAWMRRPGRVGNNVITAIAVREPTGNLDSLELAKILLERGANPNARIAWKEFKFAGEGGASVQRAKGPANMVVGGNYLTHVGATPFYLAARHGDVALMRLLVAHGADPLLPTVQNVTPLMAAAGIGFWDGETPGPLSGTPESERLEAVKLALDLGGDVNAVADFGDVPVVEGDPVTLLHGYPDHLETWQGDMRWNGSQAIHGAVLLEQPSIIKFLVEKGAKLDARNRVGWTPLMIAEQLFFGGMTQKQYPISEAVVRQMMRERNLDPDLYSQLRGTSPTAARRPQ